jgi:hypothetical protein
VSLFFEQQQLLPQIIVTHVARSTNNIMDEYATKTQACSWVLFPLPPAGGIIMINTTNASAVRNPHPASPSELSMPAFA